MNISVLNTNISDFDAAIQALVPNPLYSVNDGEFTWMDERQVPTEEEIKTQLSGQAYARNRRDAYPDWQTQFNKIYDDGIDAWKNEMIDPIKAAYPKP